MGSSIKKININTLKEDGARSLKNISAIGVNQKKINSLKLNSNDIDTLDYENMSYKKKGKYKVDKIEYDENGKKVMERIVYPDGKYKVIHFSKSNPDKIESIEFSDSKRIYYREDGSIYRMEVNTKLGRADVSYKDGKIAQIILNRNGPKRDGKWQEIDVEYYENGKVKNISMDKKTAKELHITFYDPKQQYHSPDSIVDKVSFDENGKPTYVHDYYNESGTMQDYDFEQTIVDLSGFNDYIDSINSLQEPMDY
ncbi:MAG: hypothetical protein IKF01_03780 [Bacilli bacterium]|nr:hypothetical protein [Bacilli bacterium]